ncbi:MAG: Gfo/Idh/MocA family oxidoreductase [Clostridiales bacterium]|nr:Gfo/Idh/MocA family oxidoreductase [Clostridiales bacterium]
MVSIAVLGVGNRGFEYASFVKYFHKKRAKITAVCDSNPIRLAEAGKFFRLPEDKCFADDESFFAAGKIADALFICTQDRDHHKHAVQALDLGYNVLLEKPVSPLLSECYDLEKRANEKGLYLIVCHVLRYSNHYKKIKEVLRSGDLGEIVNINHSESIAYFHFAHSYVRGNWHKESASAPSLLAKCCHDIDLIQWFMGRPCQSLTSHGDLKFFQSENAPPGASLRCLDGCRVKKECPYDAERLYITDPFYKATFIKYMGRTLTHKIKSSRADKYAALENGDYGKCVYHCDNDVMEHQEVFMDFGDGKTALHTMSAFTDKMFRKTHITCEKGEIIAQDNKTKLRVNIFGSGGKNLSTNKVNLSGHVEGDIRLIAAFLKLLNGEDTKVDDMTFIDATLPSHEIIAAAEHSRRNDGCRVDLKEFLKNEN